MERLVIGLFLGLHGLVHLWYLTLSRQWVEFQPEMGWTGQSWALSNFLDGTTLRLLASMFYGLAALVFVTAGVGMVMRTGWWQPVLAGAAVFSSVVIVIFWDGRLAQLVEKGLLGLLINVIVLAVILKT